MIHSNKFLELRLERNMNKEHLSVELCLSTSVIQLVETEPKHNPSINVILKYIKYFEVEFEDLVNGEDIKMGDYVKIVTS